MTKKESKKPILLALLILLIVTAAALLLVTSLRARTGGYPVEISEIMTANTSCPNTDGVLCDWVELHNTLSRPFALSGFSLSDETGSAKYTFPAGSEIPANGYRVVWCSATEAGDYAPFALRREGGETVCLMNKNRVVLTSRETVPCEKDQSIVWENGTAVLSDAPTPGFENSESGRTAWLSVLSERSGGTLVLSEIMSSNTLYADSEGRYTDWIEVFNPSDKPVSLSGYRLTDREGEYKYAFPDDRMLGAGEYLLIGCETAGEGEYTAPFALRRAGGESVYLLSPNGTVSESVELPALEKNLSYAKQNGVWGVTECATPGYANDEAGYAAYLAAGGYADAGIRISEVTAKNKAYIADTDGDFSDWIELTNIGSGSVSLAGWYLSDKEEVPDEWQLPDVTLAPGEYLLLFASGKNRTSGEMHTSFALSVGETVTLSAPNGVSVDSVSLDGLHDGCSLARTDAGFLETFSPTPGYENSAAGYEAFCRADAREKTLLLNEIAVRSDSGNDWVELKNLSSESVRLSEYTLGEKADEPGRYALPDLTLAPGELTVIEDDTLSLNMSEEALYLFDKNGVVLDWAWLHDIPASGSFGRMSGENGYFYFETPSKNAENTGGVRRVTAEVCPDVAPGAYDGVDSLTVALLGEGDIRYTLDGSTPTERSEKYTAPLTLTKTTVIRAIAFEKDALAGDVMTASYFLNEGSTLPIVSLVTDKGNLFGGNGIYDMHETAWAENWEREASVSLYDPEGEDFSIDCGIQIHGRTSRRASGKRSFKLCFRGKYDGALHADVFGDGAVTDFSTLLLRASLEDNYTSYMRDEIFAALAMRNTAVPAQNYKYVTLFINGEYWGIYSIREHHSENYFASHYGVDADTTEIQTGEFRRPGTWSDLLSYAETHSMADPAAWEYMQKHLDIQGLIDWLILECYAADHDVYENVRFYSSSEYNDGQVLYGLVDMDLTMMDQYETYSVGFGITGQLHSEIPNRLLANQEFRDAFLTRLGEMLQGCLSTESMNALVDELRDIIRDETARDLARWGRPDTLFDTQLTHLHDFINARVPVMVNSAASYFGLSPEQMKTYFGDLY